MYISVQHHETNPSQRVERQFVLTQQVSPVRLEGVRCLHNTKTDILDNFVHTSLNELMIGLEAAHLGRHSEMSLHGYLCVLHIQTHFQTVYFIDEETTV